MTFYREILITMGRKFPKRWKRRFTANKFIFWKILVQPPTNPTCLQWAGSSSRGERVFLRASSSITACREFDWVWIEISLRKEERIFLQRERRAKWHFKSARSMCEVPDANSFKSPLASFQNLKLKPSELRRTRVLALVEMSEISPWLSETNPIHSFFYRSWRGVLRPSLTRRFLQNVN